MRIVQNTEDRAEVVRLNSEVAKFRHAMGDKDVLLEEKHKAEDDIRRLQNELKNTKAGCAGCLREQRTQIAFNPAPSFCGWSSQVGYRPQDTVGVGS